jgi:hypothetical protein
VLFRGGSPDRPTLVYRYDPSRSGSVPKDFLGEFKGYIQTDGYAEYQALGESDDIINVGCMAHIRRKFMDVQKATPKKVLYGTAKEILNLIGLLYKVEHNIKELSTVEKSPSGGSRALSSSRRFGPSSMTASNTSRPRACSCRP